MDTVEIGVEIQEVDVQIKALQKESENFSKMVIKTENKIDVLLVKKTALEDLRRAILKVEDLESGVQRVTTTMRD